MVAAPDATSTENHHIGRDNGDSDNGGDDEEKKDKDTTRRTDNVENLLGELKNQNMRPGVAYILKVLELSGWRLDLARDWFLAQSGSTTRKRLKAISLFGEWCMRKNLQPHEVAEERHPDKWVEEYVKWLYELEGSYSLADDCKTGVSALYRDWFGIDGVGNSRLVQQTLRTKVENRTPIGRKRRIWDIGILVDAMKEEVRTTALIDLPWSQLIGRVGMLLIMFTCCRIRDMCNIVPNRSIWVTEEQSIMLAMKTKMSKGRLRFKVILHTQEREIDPIESINEYRERIRSIRGAGEHFFWEADGRPIQSSETLSRKFLIPYIRNKGVPHPYTPYSAKTAIITALFNKGLSKDQVSAHTGHTSNSNTALKHYHDPTNEWLGHMIAKFSPNPEKRVLLSPQWEESSDSTESKHESDKGRDSPDGGEKLDKTNK
jgi:hypothetical protein